MWHGDQVGYLLFEALWQAAKRGVRIRLLLDNLNTSGLNAVIAILDAHPTIEVRLYNPMTMRTARALSFLGDFTRANHRMHNKSFTADNVVTVVGGGGARARPRACTRRHSPSTAAVSSSAPSTSIRGRLASTPRWGS